MPPSLTFRSSELAANPRASSQGRHAHSVRNLISVKAEWELFALSYSQAQDRP
jgi:hypothetical protein